MGNLTYFAKSFIGNHYKENEDAFFIPSDDDNLLFGSLFVICDGVGGYKGGRIASQLAVETISEMFYSKEYKSRVQQGSFPEIMHYLISETHKKIKAFAEKDETFFKMGTTIVTAVISENHVYVHSVGDSRCYLIRNRKISQITEDQSLVWELFSKGEISKDKMISHPKKNIIRMYLGSQKELVINSYDFELQKDDMLLMCTDGISDYLIDDDILKIILENELELGNIPVKLIERAMANNSTDNLSAIIIKS